MTTTTSDRRVGPVQDVGHGCPKGLLVLLLRWNYHGHAVIPGRPQHRGVDEQAQQKLHESQPPEVAEENCVEREKSPFRVPGREGQYDLGN